MTTHERTKRKPTKNNVRFLLHKMMRDGAITSRRIYS
jgi:hypothetical protein